MSHEAWADHFSVTAAEYRRFRPIYPPELFDYLSTLVVSRRLAWDCATGNGQAASAAARYFEAVIGTDASMRQVAHAPNQTGVHLAVCRAEAVSLGANTVDLTMVAQALHWFAGEDFYREVERISTDGAIIAAWSYMLANFGSPVDPVMTHFYQHVIGSYWPPERQHVLERYTTLPFPFDELTPPSFTMRAAWTLDHLLGYVGTWSAVKRARNETGIDPLPALESELREVWGEPHAARNVTWPLHLRVGRVTK